MEVLKSLKIVAIFATFFLSLEAPCATAERILFVFPLSSKSMMNLVEPYVKGMIEKGHEVTLVTPVKFNIKSSNLTQLQFYSIQELFNDYPEPFAGRKNPKLFKFPMAFQVKYCHLLFQNMEFRELENQKWDLMINNIIHHDCFAGFFHKIGSPIIWLSTIPAPSKMPELMGNPMPSSVTNIFSNLDFSEHMTFTQRVKNFLYNLHFGYMVDTMRAELEPIYKQYLGNDLPSIEEIYKKQTSMIVMNAHFAVTTPRPNLPSIVDIGGIHCKPAKPLPKELEEFVGGDEFIIFSLGSIVKAEHLPESVRKAFVQAFSKLKQKVIWKWEKDGGMEDLSDNVKLVKWLPQQDLLGHPNIRLFITHGGLLSTEEAAYHGVPVLGMPVFVDQDANMRQAEILGFGIKGEILDLTEPQLTPLLRRILVDPRYMTKAKEISTLFRDQPETPLERAVYWAEYVMRHKGAYHLRSSAMYLNTIQYYCIDVVAFLIFAVLSSLLFLFYLIKLFVKIVIKTVFKKEVEIRRRNARITKKNR